MPSNRIQINLTYTLPDEAVQAMEEVASESERPLATVARMFLRDRVTLLNAGWGLTDKKVAEVLLSICSLPQGKRDKVMDFVKNLK